MTGFPSARAAWRASRLISVASLLAALSCAPRDTMPSAVDLALPADTTLSRMAGLRIYFGHQSVGGNLMAGLQSLEQGGLRLPIQVVRTDDPDSIPGGVIAHQWIGENGDPTGKMRAYLDALRGPTTRSVNVAMMKLCYSDFSLDVDPSALFSAYVATIDSLAEARPALVVVHVTTPIVADEGWARTLWRRVRGRMTSEQRNQKIEAYNQLMRARFASGNRMFDLAALEADGSGQSTGVPALRKAYTDDGQHLNALGQQVAATAFVRFLAGLPLAASPAPDRDH